MLGTPSFASTWLLDARLPTPSHRFRGSTPEDVAQWKAELLPRLRSTLLDAGVAELPAAERWPLQLKVLETETSPQWTRWKYMATCFIKCPSLRQSIKI